MRINALGIDNLPLCYLLNFNDREVLLDFPFEFSWDLINASSSLQAVLHSIPFSSIDIPNLYGVFISNVFSMLALPILTNNPEFKGKIFTTAPILETGKIWFKDVLENIKNSGNTVQQTLNEEPCDFLRHSNLLEYFNEESIKNCIEKIQVLSFYESHVLFRGFTFSCFSSGYMYGSCNWLFYFNNRKIVYISASSLFNTHSLSLDKKFIEDADIMLVAQLAGLEYTKPDKTLKNILTIITKFVNEKGYVLIPLTNIHLLYDILEYLYTFLESERFHEVKIYCVSPSISEAFAYASISSEWMNPEKLNKSISGQPPFNHSKMMESNRVICWEYLSETKLSQEKNMKDIISKPSIIICSDPTLSCGASLSLFQHLKNDPKNCTLFLDFNFKMETALLPHSGVKMQCIEECIDTRISYSQLIKLLNELRPQKIIVFENDLIGLEEYCEKKLKNMKNLKFIGMKYMEETTIKFGNDNLTEIIIDENLANETTFFKNSNNLSCPPCVFMNLELNEKQGLLYGKAIKTNINKLIYPIKIDSKIEILRYKLQEYLKEEITYILEMNKISFNNDEGYVVSIDTQDDIQIDIKSDYQDEKRNSIVNTIIEWMNSVV